MDRKVIALALSVALVAMPYATVAIPVPLILLAGGIAGATLYHLVLGILADEPDYTEAYNFINSTLAGTFETQKQQAEVVISDEILSTSAHLLFQRDMANKTKNYAWSLAQYTLVKELEEGLNSGLTFDQAKVRAKTEAISRISEYYLNLSKNAVFEYEKAIEYYNATYRVLASRAMPEAIAVGTMCCLQKGAKCLGTAKYFEFESGQYLFYYTARAVVEAPECSDISYKDYTATVVYPDGHTEGAILGGMPKPEIEKRTYSCSGLGGFEYYYLKFPTWGYYGSRIPNDINRMTKNLTATLTSLCNAYNQVVDNIAAYSESITETIYKSGDPAKYLDPATIAYFLNTGYNETGYYGYAALSAAMLGLNLTNLNYTVKIHFDDKTVEGILFTDWNGTLEVGKTYYADPSYMWYILTTSGSMLPFAGYNFTILELRDKEGKLINKTILVHYVDHTGDIQDIYKELDKLMKIYREYVNMTASLQAQQQPGIFDQLSSWWNSLTTEQKMLVVAGAGLGFILLIYALRGRGGGTVVLKG